MNLQDLFRYLIGISTLQRVPPTESSVGVPAANAVSHYSNNYSESSFFKNRNVKIAVHNSAGEAGNPSYPASSGGKPMIDSINEYRKRAGLPAQIWDNTLVSNAAKTGQATGGKAMVHQMNRGTRGQVLAMGVDDGGRCTRDFASLTPFEVYFYSWLCEVPEHPALLGECNRILRTSRIMSAGQTGHYRILSSKGYKKIGCAFTKNSKATKCATWTGIWACDLG
jgi:Cysteine-rich secretory protein family